MTIQERVFRGTTQAVQVRLSLLEAAFQRGVIDRFGLEAGQRLAALVDLATIGSPAALDLSDGPRHMGGGVGLPDGCCDAMTALRRIRRKFGGDSAGFRICEALAAADEAVPPIIRNASPLAVTRAFRKLVDVMGLERRT